jgi:hypothetical protein
MLISEIGAKKQPGQVNKNAADNHRQDKQDETKTKYMVNNLVGSAHKQLSLREKKGGVSQYVRKRSPLSSALRFSSRILPY